MQEDQKQREDDPKIKDNMKKENNFFLNPATKNFWQDFLLNIKRTIISCIFFHEISIGRAVKFFTQKISKLGRKSYDMGVHWKLNISMVTATIHP